MLHPALLRFGFIALSLVGGSAARAQIFQLGPTCMTGEWDDETPAGPTPQLWFPNHGRINALIVFVQQEGDNADDCLDRDNRNDYRQPALITATRDSAYYETCGLTPGGDDVRYESSTDDEETEWPAFRMSSGNISRPLPDWAGTLIDAPGTRPGAYTEGSLSDYYYTMSQGGFRLEGQVYPEVIMFSQEPDALFCGNNYTDIASDIINYINDNSYNIDFGLYDRYLNGTNQYVYAGVEGEGEPVGDGVFDMLILVPRTGITPLASFDNCGLGSGGTENDHFSEPLYLRYERGGVLDSVRVKSDVRYGSGVWSSGLTRHRVVSLTAHEIGHRQISVDHEPANAFGIMGGHQWVGMAATDRYKLGWLDPVIVPVPATLQGSYAIDDAFLTGDALCFSPAGDCLQEGDVVVEARTLDSYWNGSRYSVDGDWWDDAHRGEEGVMVYSRRSTGAYDSMERTGLPFKTHLPWDVWSIPGGRFTYTTGDDYTPFTFMGFGSAATDLNGRLGLVGIQRSGAGFTFDVFGDFPRYGGTRTLHFSALSRLSVAGTAERTIGGRFRFEDMDDDLYTESETLTLLPGAQVSVPTGSRLQLSGFEGIPHREIPPRDFPVVLGEGASILVNGGALLTDRVDFRAADTEGWHGIHFQNNAYSELRRTDITGVEPSSVLDIVPGALTVYGGLVYLDSVAVSGTVGTDGLHAEGGGAEVVVSNRSRFLNNGGYGVVAAAGAQVTVEGDSRVEENTAGGILSTGKGSTISVGLTTIGINDGPGVAAHDLGYVSFDEGTGRFISGNVGGLAALDGGEMTAGICGHSGCNHEPSDIELNAASSGYDAASLDGSVLFAEGNRWGLITDPSGLVLLTDMSSYLSVEPFADSGSLLRGTAERSARTDAEGSGRGGGIPAFAEATRLLASGDTTEAIATVTTALQEAETEDEVRAAFEAAARILARAQPSSVVTWMEGQATGASRPWALRSLTVAYAETGRTNEAEAAAGSLVTEYEESEHAVAGHAALVRLAVEGEDEGGALTRLGALAAAAPESEAAIRMAALVAAAFPEADPGEAFAGRTGGRVMTSAGPGVDAQRHVFGVGPVAPNPVGTAARVPVTLDVAGHVEVAVYDALGRRVALIHDGALTEGDHALVLYASPLSAGAYVVRVVARPEGGGAARVAVRRLTVVR